MLGFLWKQRAGSAKTVKIRFDDRFMVQVGEVYKESVTTGQLLQLTFEAVPNVCSHQ
jgi:hypothetical protein